SALFGNSQLLIVPGEHHNRGSPRQQLGVLHGVVAESARAKDCHYAVRPENAGGTQFFYGSIGRNASIGDGRQLLPRQLIFHRNPLPIGNRDELGVPSRRTESRPASVLADLLIPKSALAADSVPPARSDNDLVANS